MFSMIQTLRLKVQMADVAQIFLKITLLHYSHDIYWLDTLFKHLEAKCRILIDENIQGILEALAHHMLG